MLENALTSRNLTVSARTAWKTAVSAGIIVLAVVLPQIVHLAMGQPGGAKWLPMYLPVLLGGLLLGTRWALPVGLISPLVSYLVTSALGSLALTLNKFAADCAMYMSPNFGFIHFPDELTTGSSIMPHKKNPDVWEIVRGRCNQTLGTPNEIALLASNLPHGYHRDFQLLKDILFPALERMHDCLQMT
ncbi:MAG: lyase family protein, partial [Eubacteriales bacterium]